jgi:hypothetical protein
LSAQATKSAPPSAANATYEAVVRGMSCRQQSSGRLECEYKVGDGLHLQVSGVGQVDVVVNFLRVDAASAYVAGVAPLHGCVIVRPAHASADSAASLAFISSVDGKVYRNWNTCPKPSTKR